MKKGTLFLTVLFLFCIIFSGCSIKTKNTVMSESRKYINFSYVDANNTFKSDSEASKYAKAHNNKCVIWTIPVKEIVNNKIITLQASGLSEVYANFNYNLDTKDIRIGNIITISGYIQGYTKGFLDEASAWTLSDCRIEKTNPTDEDALNDYVSSIADSKGTNNSTDVSTNASSGFSFTPEEFKNNLLAQDNNFTVLPSFKSGSADALDNLYYSYKSTNNSYLVSLCTKDTKVSLIEYSYVLQSQATNTKPLDLMNDILYIVYGNKTNDNYSKAAAFVKQFYNKNQAVSDYHTGSENIGNYTITLITRSKNMSLKMIIQPD